MRVPDRDADYVGNGVTKLWFHEMIAQTRVVQSGEVVVLPLVFSISSKELSVYITKEVADNIHNIFGPQEGEILEFTERVQAHYSKWLVEKAIAEACIGHDKT